MNGLFRTIRMVNLEDFREWIERGADSNDEYFVSVWKEHVEKLDNRLRKNPKTVHILKQINKVLFKKQYNDDFMEVICVLMLCTEEQRACFKALNEDMQDFMDMVVVTLFYALGFKRLPLKKEVYSWKGSEKLTDDERIEVLTKKLLKAKRLKVAFSPMFNLFRRKHRITFARIIARVMLNEGEEKYASKTNITELVYMMANYATNKLTRGKTHMENGDVKTSLP